MTLASFALFIIPILIGFFIVHLLWIESQNYFLKFALGIGVGLGATSLLYFLFLLLFAGRSGFIFVLLVTLIALAIPSFNSIRRIGIGFSLQKISWQQVIFLALLLVTALLASATLVSTTLRRPHGGFDAWLIWNRASRFLYRGGADWQTAFSPAFYFFFHADYPLMLPLNNAWAWGVLNTDTLRVPFVQGALYLFGTAALLFSAVHHSRGLVQASLSSTLLLGTVTLLTIGSAQMADIPLALLILSVTISFYLFSKTKQVRLLALAGFLTGLCGWMKNEGDVFILFSIFAFFLILLKEENKKEKVIWYIAGLVFPLLVILYFKLMLAPSNDLAQTPAQALQKITDLSRYALIWNYILAELKTFGGWMYLIPALILYYFVAREKDDLSRWRVSVTSMLGLQVLSYLAVYVVTTMDLSFHLSTSFGRILLHVYPAFLFILFTSTVSVDRVMTSNN